MPHITIEYTANLEPELRLGALIAALHEVAAGIEAFPRAGLRTRAERRDHYLVAEATAAPVPVLSLAAAHDVPAGQFASTLNSPPPSPNALGESASVTSTVCRVPLHAGRFA